AGRVPFPEGTTLQKLIAQQEQQPQPISQLRPDIPPDLSAVLDRLLAKDPAHRFQTPAELADALSPFARPGPVLQAAQEQIHARAWPPGRRRFLIAAAAILPAAGFGGYLLWRHLAGGPESEVETTPPEKLPSEAEIRRLSSKSGSMNAVGWTPNGGKALAALPDGRLEAWDLDKGKVESRFGGHPA